MTSPYESIRYYPSVQGLRGLSALSVVAEHVYLMARHGDLFPGAPAVVELAWATLGNATALFFIISGFVIPASLTRHGDVRRFLVDRALRIMPVFVAIHLLVFCVGPFTGYKWLRDIDLAHYLVLFLTNLTFTAPLLGLPIAQQNSWTLTCEWLFYGFTAIAWLVTRRPAGTTAPRLLLAAIAVLACVGLPIAWFFGVGLAFARFGARFGVRPGTWSRIGLAAEAVTVPLGLATFYYCAQYVSFYAAIPPGTLIFWFVLQDGSLTSRLLGARPLQWLGLVSYSLYLLHPIVMYPLEMVGARLVRHGFSAELVFPAFAAASIVLALAASHVSYRVLEVGARRRLAIWVNRRDRGAVRVSGSPVSQP